MNKSVENPTKEQIVFLEQWLNDFAYMSDGCEEMMVGRNQVLGAMRERLETLKKNNGH